MAENYPPSVTAKAHMHVHQLRAAYDAALEECDVLITPVNSTVGMRHPNDRKSVLSQMTDGMGSAANVCPFNLTGHPALSMPVGWGKVSDGEERLPIGMQIIGKRWDEEMVLKAAAVWEVMLHPIILSPAIYQAPAAAIGCW